ncbi:MAG: cupin domain-containing protein [Chloroflexia bacterium]|nr:cupin domain-containing protein [Chloroflexia bacterium]
MAKMNLAALGARLETPWLPLEVARLGDYHCLLVLYQGSYPAHHHDKDEFFLVLEGTVDIEIEGAGTVTLHEKEGLLVQAGQHHRPITRTASALVLLFESKDLSYKPVVMVAQADDQE